MCVVVLLERCARKKTRHAQRYDADRVFHGASVRQVDPHYSEEVISDKVRPMRRYLRLAILAVVFGSILEIRIHGIERHFWLLEDQIRDWSIALGPLRQLPLVGPPTHVGGYTIGPAFYWIIWLIRVTFGPWFQNLPHAGGIGQAALQSAADTLLLFAVWRRTGSLWVALAATVFIATAGYDLCLSALVWNPMAGTALVKIATALVLLGWPERSCSGVIVTAAVAWCAVQCYTGAIFATIGVFFALVAVPFVRREHAIVRRNAALIAGVVLALQLPYAIHQLSTHFSGSAMGAVTGSMARILTGQDPPQLTNSWAGYFSAFNYIQVAPWNLPWFFWVVIAGGVVTTLKYRRDPALLAVTVLPQVAALIGYAFYVGDFLDHYYYFSLMPAAVLTILLACTAVRSRVLAQTIAIGLFAFSLVIAPSRIAFGRTLHQLPEYGLLLDGSRKIAKVPQPMRAIRTEFPLPPSTNPGFLYTILGGRLERGSPYVAEIKTDGSIVFHQVAAQD
jgi:hypothetical protein